MRACDRYEVWRLWTGARRELAATATSIRQAKRLARSAFVFLGCQSILIESDGVPMLESSKLAGRGMRWSVSHVSAFAEWRKPNASTQDE